MNILRDLILDMLQFNKEVLVSNLFDTCFNLVLGILLLSFIMLIILPQSRIAKQNIK